VADDTYDVFVSYSRADGRHAAEIDSVLRDKGLKTFFDCRNLGAGLFERCTLSAQPEPTRKAHSDMIE
jgi:hypothetical protein